MAINSDLGGEPDNGAETGGSDGEQDRIDAKNSDLTGRQQNGAETSELDGGKNEGVKSHTTEEMNVPQKVESKSANPVLPNDRNICFNFNFNFG